MLWLVLCSNHRCYTRVRHLLTAARMISKWYQHWHWHQHLPSATLGDKPKFLSATASLNSRCKLAGSCIVESDLFLDEMRRRVKDRSKRKEKWLCCSSDTDDRSFLFKMSSNLMASTISYLGIKSICYIDIAASNTVLQNVLSGWLGYRRIILLYSVNMSIASEKRDKNRKSEGQRHEMAEDLSWSLPSLMQYRSSFLREDHW